MGTGSITDNFFVEQSEKSAIKSAIVSNFFKVYLRIISKRYENEEIYYIDLFSGPGMYDDGSKSTPLYIMDALEAYNDNKVFDRFHFVFNEDNKVYYDKLVDNIKSHTLYTRLNNEPIITNQSAEQIDLSVYAKGNNPVFSFVDPFGYKSTSAKQIWDLVHGIGSDCIFFFNANRIIMDFKKDNKEHFFRELFGDYYSELGNKLSKIQSHHEKMAKVLEAFSMNLKDLVKSKPNNYQLFVLPFGFAFDDRERESHYLLFITKNHKAVCEMKSIMSKVANSICEFYSFDSKKINQLSFFNIQDDAYVNFKATIKCFKKQLENRRWALVDFLKTIDILSMQCFHKVAPFSQKETKSFLRRLYNEGKLISELPFSKREVFSDKRYFIIK